MLLETPLHDSTNACQCMVPIKVKDFWLQVGVNFFEVGVCFVPSTGTTSESFCITVSVWYHVRIYVRLN